MTILDGLALAFGIVGLLVLVVMAVCMIVQVGGAILEAASRTTWNREP
jgi:hypothetical protein